MVAGKDQSSAVSRNKAIAAAEFGRQCAALREGKLGSEDACGPLKPDVCPNGSSRIAQTISLPVGGEDPVEDDDSNATFWAMRAIGSLVQAHQRGGLGGWRWRRLAQLVQQEVEAAAAMT